MGLHKSFRHYKSTVDAKGSLNLTRQEHLTTGTNIFSHGSWRHNRLRHTAMESSAPKCRCCQSSMYRAGKAELLVGCCCIVLAMGMKSCVYVCVGRS